MADLEKNKAIGRRIPEEIFNKGNLGVADEIIAKEFVDHSALPGAPAGIEGLKFEVNLLRSAFPDLRYTIEYEIAEGDKVAGRLRAAGTHKGEFFGVRPTGKKVTWTEMHTICVENGKIVEHWGEVDMFGVMQQLGAVPEQARVQR